MVDRVESFPAAYVVDDADAATDAGASHGFRTDGVSALAPRFEVDVTPADGEPWRGAFFGGRDDLDVVVHSPSSNHLVVVAGGVGYVVPVLDPEAYAVVSLRPVREVETSESAGVVVLIGFTSMLAVGATGQVAWSSDRLVSDGFTEVRLTIDSIVVRGYDAPSDSDIETTLSLSSGEILDRR